MNIGLTVRVISFLILASYPVVVKAGKWIPLDAQKEGKIITTEIINSDQTEYKVRVTIHGLTDELITNECGEFHRLSIGRDSYLSNVGEPLLPTFSQLIAIPAGADVSASIIEEQWTDVSVGKIYPKQKSHLEGDKSNNFDYDEKTYLTSYIPKQLYLGDSMQWRQIKNCKVSVCPFKYYPQESRLSIMIEFVLLVRFTNTNPINDSFFKFTEDPYCLFENIPITEPFLTQKRYNSGMVRSETSTSDYYNYLIIVGDIPGILGSKKMAEFRRWKAQKGFKTRVVSTSEIGTAPEVIKDSILQEYHKGVRYVLFVGDHEKINLKEYFTPWNSLILSDYWYGCLNEGNSLQADVAIGRFSVGSYTDFSNIVDKTIKYERTHNSSNSALLMAHFEGADMMSLSPWSYQGCCEQIYENHCDDILFAKAYGACNATNSDVLTAINSGIHIVNYRGHGSPVLWGKRYGDDEDFIYTWNISGEAFTASEINNMNNETCAIFFSVACETGRIAGETCMLETFTRANHGAVAFIGATEDTDPDVNNSFDKLLFDKLLNDNVYHLGDLNVSAHIANYCNSDNPSNHNYEDNALSYVCGGDPALEIWTSEPQPMSVDWSIVNGSVTLNTNLTGSYYVTVASVNGERLDSIGCSSSTCIFPFPANHDQLYITVNQHNYFPYVIYYDSVSEDIVDTTFDYDAFYTASPLDIFAMPPAFEEEVVVKSGHKLSIKNGSGGVKIWENFKCEKGARFEIK